MELKNNKVDIELEAKLQRDTLLQAIKKDRLDLQAKGSSVEDSFKYIDISLYQISVSIAYLVRITESGKRVVSKDIESLINDYTDLLKFQISKVEFVSIRLSFEQMEKNFEYWNIISTSVLKKIVLKNYYIAQMLAEYFELDRRWTGPVMQLVVMCAQVGLNYTDTRVMREIAGIRGGEQALKNYYSTEDIAQLRELMKKTLEIQVWAAEKSVATWAQDRNKFFAERAMMFWDNCIQLYNLQGEKSQADTFTDKKENFLKRIEKESSKVLFEEIKDEQGNELGSFSDL